MTTGKRKELVARIYQPDGSTKVLYKIGDGHLIMTYDPSNPSKAHTSDYPLPRKVVDAFLEESLRIEAMSMAVEMWAKSEPLVRKAYLFGSRVKGTNRPDSDLDVAIELLTLPDEEDPGTTWQREGKRLKASIAGVVSVAIDLDWYGGADETACIHAGLQGGSLVAYDAE